MRALVTRSVRPRIRSTSTTNIPSITSPIRHSIFPPTRRKLTLSDAFTILLAPVFAAAFVADATLKDRKRREWDQKIAEIRAEIEAIHERELQSWNAVQLRSVQVGVKHQRRGYTTAARAVISEQQSGLELKEARGQQIEARPEQDLSSTVSRDELPVTEPEALNKTSRRREGIFDPRVLANWQRYESLLASKLALELLLHLRTGKSWLYRQPTDIPVHPDLFPESLDGLMVQLHRVNDALKQLNSKKRPGEVPYRLLAVPDRNLLHEDIANMAKACKEGKITVVQLVYGYASAIGNSKTAPKSTSYRALMDAFLTLDNESLAYTAMSALQNCQQRLNNADIGTMLFQYGHFKDSGKFSGFLRLLVKKEDSCILRLKVPWEHTSVKGVRVPIPVDRNTRLISTCIQAALQCGMVQQAEAWTAVLFQTGNRDQLGTVMKHIITYYTEHCDWTYGSKWLQEMIKHAALIADENAESLTKCIMRMFELCVACNNPAMYERLMKAVLAANIQPETINYSRPEFFSDRVTSIRKDWMARRKSSLTIKDSSKKLSSCVEQAIRFQEVLMQEDPSLHAYIGVTSGLEMVARTESVRDRETIQTRPFHTPTELLGGSQASSELAEGPRSESKQHQAIGVEESSNTEQEILYNQRIVELEKQLSESQRRNTELLEKLNNQSSATQRSAKQNQNDPKPKPSLSHLHLLTDHQKLLRDYADLKTSHQILQENQEAQKRQIPLNKQLTKDQYATALPNIDTVPGSRRSGRHYKSPIECLG